MHKFISGDFSPPINFQQIKYLLPVEFNGYNQQQNRVSIWPHGWTTKHAAFLKAFRATNTKGTEAKQCHNHSFVLCTDLIKWHEEAIEFQWEEQSLLRKNEYPIVLVCKQLLTTNLWISLNNKYRDTENWYAYSNDWFSKGHRLTNDLLLRTHQLYVVNFFVSITFKCCNSVFVKGEGHSLQSLLLGVHTDVRLHLNTPSKVL